MLETYLIDVYYNIDVFRTFAVIKSSALSNFLLFLQKNDNWLEFAYDFFSLSFSHFVLLQYWKWNESYAAEHNRNPHNCLLTLILLVIRIKTTYANTNFNSPDNFVFLFYSSFALNKSCEFNYELDSFQMHCNQIT